MSTSVNPVSGSGATPSTTSAAQVSSGADPLANEETFLKLLVSQLQNQDPMNPTDSNQFVSQLTSYSQLEQLIGIHGDTTNLVSGLTGTQSSSSSGASGSSGSNSQAGTSTGTNPTTGN
jgi:flagellar basal-body rod modification protein FlgD